MSNVEFAIAEVMPGRLNALVKNLMRQMGIEDPNEAVRRVNAGEWVVSRVGSTVVVSTGGITIISVDYGHTLEEMIAAGRYDWVNSDITAKRFPISGVGVMQFETKLFHFGHDISSDEAERRIAADDPTNPWTPAKIEHTLA